MHSNDSNAVGGGNLLGLVAAKFRTPLHFNSNKGVGMNSDHLMHSAKSEFDNRMDSNENDVGTIVGQPSPSLQHPPTTRLANSVLIKSSVPPKNISDLNLSE